MPKGNRQILRMPKVLSSDRHTRSITLQSFVFAFAVGIYAGGEVIFLVRIVGISASEVAIGVTLGGAVAAVATVLVGRIADRFGGRNVWVIAACTEAAIFLSIPFIGSATQFYIVAMSLSVTTPTAAAARGAYILATVPVQSRVESQAYIRNGFIIGASAGAALGGILIAKGAVDITRFLPAAAGALLIANAIIISRLPNDLVQTTKSRGLSTNNVQGGRISRGHRLFMSVVLSNGLLMIHRTALGVAIPLWIASSEKVPLWVIPAVILVNNLLTVLLQVRFSRRIDDLGASASAALSSGIFTVFGLVACYGASYGSVAASLSLVIVGTVLLTIAEVKQSVAGWGLLSYLDLGERRGEYQGIFNLGGSIERLAGPITATTLMAIFGAGGWLILALAPALAATHMWYLRATGRYSRGLLMSASLRPDERAG